MLDRFKPAEGDVLVVDDDADTRERLRHAPEKLGWTVAEAANGQLALDAVANGVPRLIMLDLAMPVMDGFEFLNRLREQPVAEPSRWSCSPSWIFRYRTDVDFVAPIRSSTREA